MAKVLTYAIWSVTLLAASGGIIDPEDMTIPAAATLALPYLAIVSFLLILAWALSGRLFFAGFGFLMMAICITPIHQAFPTGCGHKAPENAETFKIISWNVLHTNDLRSPENNTNRAAEYMLNSGADIICLAELDDFSPSEFKKASEQLLDSLERTYPYRAGLNTNDIKVMSKYPVERLAISDSEDFSENRFEFFKVQLPGHQLNVAMVHLYSYDLSEDERQIMKEMKSVEGAKESVRELQGSIREKLGNAFRQRAVNARNLRKAIEKTEGPLIVCGDFNDVPASWTYNIIAADDMRDAYIETNFGPRNTYNLHGFYFHIDQMLYRGPLEALKLKVGKINTSDHYPLIGEFAFLDTGTK